MGVEAGGEAGGEAVDEAGGEAVDEAGAQRKQGRGHGSADAGALTNSARAVVVFRAECDPWQHEHRHKAAVQDTAGKSVCMSVRHGASNCVQLGLAWVASRHLQEHNAHESQSVTQEEPKPPLQSGTQSA